eukprot:403363122
MKFLILEDYQKSANEESGISREKELLMIQECITYIQKIAKHFQVRINICGTALTIFHLYTCKHPFTEFDRQMLSTLCLHLACKIDYHKVTYEKLIEYYYLNRKQARGKVKPFDEIKELLLEDFVDLEFKILTCIQFDFEFDLPFKHLERFKDTYLNQFVLQNKLQHLNEDKLLLSDFKNYFDLFLNLAQKFCLDSYLQSYCLYFPGAVITAGCLLISAIMFNKMEHTVDKVSNTQMKGSEILLQKFGIQSFLFIKVDYQDPQSQNGNAQLTYSDMVQQNHEWLNYVNKDPKPDEYLAIEDVMYLKDDIINKIIDQINL